jgi:cellulose biosynthesis protein BcsQ
MALIAVAADKGAPGVTTTALALAAVWPRPVLLAECDPAGGDLVYRLPTGDGGRLDPRRGLLSLAVAARRGLQPQQTWEHVQKLHGGLDVLTGVTNADQGAGLNLLWGPVGRVLAANAQADVIADCGRLGVDGPLYDLLAEAQLIVLVTRASLGEVVRLRDRAAAVAAGLRKRNRPGLQSDVVVIADYRHFRTTTAEVGEALSQVSAPARVVGGLADDAKGADLLRGEWGGKLDKSLLIRTARTIAENLVARLPETAPDQSPQSSTQSPAQPAGRHSAGVPDGPGAGPDPEPEPYVSPATWATRGYPPVSPAGPGSPLPDQSHAASPGPPGR